MVKNAKQSEKGQVVEAGEMDLGVDEKEGTPDLSGNLL